MIVRLECERDLRWSLAMVLDPSIDIASGFEGGIANKQYNAGIGIYLVCWSVAFACHFRARRS